MIYARKRTGIAANEGVLGKCVDGNDKKGEFQESTLHTTNLADLCISRCQVEALVVNDDTQMIVTVDRYDERLVGIHEHSATLRPIAIYTSSLGKSVMMKPT